MSKEDEETLSEFRRVLQEHAFIDMVTVDFDESLQAYVFKVNGLRRKNGISCGDPSGRITPFSGFFLLRREVVLSTTMSTEDLVDECLKNLYASVSNDRAQMPDVDVEVEIPPGEKVDDPGLHDATGKALEAGYGNVVGMTIEIKRKQ